MSTAHTSSTASDTRPCAGARRSPTRYSPLSLLFSLPFTTGICCCTSMRNHKGRTNKGRSTYDGLGLGYTRLGGILLSRVPMRILHCLRNQLFAGHNAQYLHFSHPNCAVSLADCTLYHHDCATWHIHCANSHEHCTRSNAGHTPDKHANPRPL